MSRQLPARPNLEHLRKQAKERLVELARQDPGVTLGDAQRAIAGEYGFSSWALLKAHVLRVLDGDSTVPPIVRHPLAGSWVADVSRSTPHPSNRYRAATLRFEVDGDLVTIIDVVVDETGREERGRNTFRADGQAHPADGGFFMTGNWRGARVLEVVVTKHGRTEGRVTYEVSPDEATLTLTTGEQRGVFGRLAG